MLATIKKLLPAVGAIFHLRVVLIHVLAILLSIILILSGFDWWFYQMTRLGVLSPLVWLAGLGGFIVPCALPTIIVALGYMRGDARLVRLGTTIAFAIILGLFLSYFYKAFTGRAHPQMFGIDTTDITKVFQFGFLRGGVFWGWPSSHTTVAFAASVALMHLVQNHAMKVAAIVYAIFIGLGAAIGFHWFSDVVAGALFGSLVGFTVARFGKLEE